MHLLAIDSGIQTGWAILSGDAKAITIHAAGTARTKIEAGLTLQKWADRTADVLVSLEPKMKGFRIRRVAIEFPEFTKGESNKLCFMAGRTAGWAAAKFNASVQLVGVNEWKGQLPKPLSARRVLLRIEQCCVYSPSIDKSNVVTNHTVDALGVGLYSMGVFIKK